MLANMIEAQEAPASGPVEIGRRMRCLELTGLIAAGMRALRPRSFDAAMPTVVLHARPGHSTTIVSPGESAAQRVPKSAIRPRILATASLSIAGIGTSDWLHPASAM